jgi:hypothetical protein
MKLNVIKPLWGAAISFKVNCQSVKTCIIILKIDTVVVTIKGYEIYVLSHFVIINNTFVGSRDIKIKRNGA